MNWTIALVDDEKIQQDLIKKLLKEYEAMHSIQLNIFTFESAEAFLFHFEEDKSVELLILDIEMGKMNGMELAHYLRKQRHDLKILFVTGYSKYSLDGYKVDAVDYLLKPIDREKLFQVLDRIRALRPRKNEYLILETTDGSARINQRDLISLEALGHETIIQTVEEPIEIKQGLGTIQAELPENIFVKPHRSYLINIEHVNKISKTEVYLTNGVTVPVSRRLYKKVNESFIRYFRGSE